MCAKFGANRSKTVDFHMRYLVAYKYTTGLLITNRRISRLSIYRFHYVLPEEILLIGFLSTSVEDFAYYVNLNLNLYSTGHENVRMILMSQWRFFGIPFI